MIQSGRAARYGATAMSLPTLLNTVRSHGMRVSTARRSVLEALLAAGEPLTAEELAGDADLASTYRNLETLESIGIVRHVHLGHGPGRYELSGRSAGWATCEGCGRSTPLPSPALCRRSASRCARRRASRPPSRTSRSSGAARDCAPPNLSRR